MKKLFLLLTISLTSFAASAKLIEKSVPYKQGDTELQGFLVYDDSGKQARPGVLVVHDWMGLNDFSKGRARELAKMGYVAFAADLYGKNLRPKNAKEAGEFATKYKADRPLLRKRIEAAYQFLSSQQEVDKNRMGAIGYCFGGTTVLELARTGANLKSVVTFHGGLDNPAPTGKAIKAKILSLHGADDPFVNAKEVADFQQEMREGKVDWTFVSYGNAVHAFSIPDAGSDNSKGAAFNKLAAERSWSAMKQFFTETL